MQRTILSLAPSASPLRRCRGPYRGPGSEEGAFGPLVPDAELKNARVFTRADNVNGLTCEMPTGGAIPIDHDCFGAASAGRR